MPQAPPADDAALSGSDPPSGSDQPSGSDHSSGSERPTENRKTSVPTKKSFDISGAPDKEEEPVTASKAAENEEEPVCSDVVAAAADNADDDNEEMKEFQEKKRLLGALSDCDNRIEKYETSLLNLHSGKVCFCFNILLWHLYFREFLLRQEIVVFAYRFFFFQGKKNVV